MPLTLWRFTFTEVMRLVLLASSVLVVIISFAVAIKPLADGKLEPGQAVTFMLLALPPMLAYALPFAAGFGATLAYHRMAVDNELVAARSGGIPFRSLSLPAIVAGLGLGAVLLTLNEQVIPRFLRSMESMITLNLADALIRSMERGEAARVEGAMIYADAVTPLPTDQPGTRGYLLDGLVAIVTGAQGAAPNAEDLRVVSAARAALWLMPASAMAQQPAAPGTDAPALQHDATALVINAQNVVGYTPDGVVENRDLTWAPGVLPRTVRDDPKFLTTGELDRAEQDPELLADVRDARRRLATQLGRHELLERITNDLAQGRPVEFIGQSAGLLDRVLLLAATVSLEPSGALRLSGADGLPVIIERERRDPATPNAPGTLDRYEAAEATLVPVRDAFAPAGQSIDLSPRATFALEARNAVRLLDDLEGTGDAQQDAMAAEMRAPLDLLRLPAMDPAEDPVRARSGQDAAALLDAADALAGRVPAVHDAARALRNLVLDVRREILSKRHERWAMAASCVVMVLTGALAGMRLRDRSTLVVYLWAFLPALVGMLTIASGQRVTHDAGPSGLFLLWGGVAGLTLYTLTLYAGLARR